MNEHQFAENLMYYRKKQGLSQEKVAEYMHISRQAVTKWEANISQPSSDNLIKLAQLFKVDVDTLLGNGKEENTSIQDEIAQDEITIGKTPWIFIGLSVLFILAYIVNSAVRDTITIGTLICMFILCVPIQLFLHIYFSATIKNNSFSGIAGFDDKTEYNICEVKKLLVQIDLHIGILSTVYIFLFCVINSIGLEMTWFNSILVVVYSLNFIASIIMNNYKIFVKSI